MSKWLLLFILSSSPVVWSGPVLTFPVDVSPRSNVEKEQAEKLMQKLDELFREDIKARGLELKWQWDWENPYIGAGSFPPRGEFKIMLWGGFVRAPQMTLPALALILCHELGHQLGGAPYLPKDKYPDFQISVEGQADFFATQTCWPRLMQSHFLVQQKFSEYSLKFCRQDTTCASSLDAAQDLARVFHLYFDRFNPLARIENQSKEKVTKTIDLAYPTDQCRIDTFKAGALCAQRSSLCERPRCWFAPE